MQPRFKPCFSALGPALVLGGLMALTGCVSTAATATTNNEARTAAANACLIEGSVQLFGKPVPVKDCLEGASSSQERLAQICQTALQSVAKQVKNSGGEAPRLSQPKACPAGAAATCEGYAGLPLTAHYYLRDTTQLQATKDSCLAQGGQWKP
jgi:di/tricarboxylate transporter